MIVANFYKNNAPFIGSQNARF